ncbi:MAG: hypothetical protein IPL28_07605 [Chloroflexi bacterium]|nr:hypothetical protein [Chloroflexota bacterium]
MQRWILGRRVLRLPHHLQRRPGWHTGLVGAGLCLLPSGAEEQRSGGAEDAPAPVLGQPNTGQPQGLPLQDTQSAIPNPESPILPHPTYTNTLDSPADPLSTQHSAPSTLFNSPAFTRLEQDDAAISYTGSWSNVNLTPASGGTYWRNNVAGSTAEFSFDGTWFNLGFVYDWPSGYAQLHVDGQDYGILDLYRHRETPLSLFYNGLPSGTHTVTLTVLGTGNPLGNNVNIRFDYVDFGDGSALLPRHDRFVPPRLCQFGRHPHLRLHGLHSFPHVLQVLSYCGATSIDKITTPA